MSGLVIAGRSGREDGPQSSAPGERDELARVVKVLFDGFEDALLLKTDKPLWDVSRSHASEVTNSTACRDGIAPSQPGTLAKCAG